MVAALIAKRLVLVVVTPFVVLASMECTLRLTGSSPRSPLSIGFGARDPVLDLTEEDRDLIWRFVPNLHVSGRGWEFSFSTNRLGLRGNLPSREKAANAYRIVCLGDSTAFGHINSYPEELADVLGDALPGRTIEVINAGIPGFSARQGFELFARDLLQYRPDLVTWCFGFNNTRRCLDRRSDDAIIEERKRGISVAGWLMRRSALAAWIATKVTSTSVEPTSESVCVRVDSRRFAELTAATAILARDAGAAFVAIEQPHAFDRNGDSPIDEVRREQLGFEARLLDEQRAALESRCAADGIPFVPMHRYFAELEDDDYFIGPCPDGDVVHPSPIGLRYFAERLAAELDRIDVLPGSAHPKNLDSTIAPPSFAVTDLDGDGDYELLAATTRAGVCELAIVEPMQGGIRRLPLDLQPPAESCSLSHVPALGGAIILTRSGRDHMIVAESLDVPESTARFGPFEFATLPGVEWVRAVAVDLQGDDEPEYAVECGPLSPPFQILLDERLATLAPISHSFEPTRGTSIIAWPYENSGGIERLAIAGVVRGLGVEVVFGVRDSPPRARSAHHLVLDRPCATFYLRGGDGGVRRVVWRAPALFVEDGEDVTALFPWGAARCDPDAPRIGISTAGKLDSPTAGTIVASLAGHRLEWARVDASGSQAKTVTVLAEKP